ncbi:MAG TPA: MFS transporter [Marmoricola sp.]|nr:MFS transporter [Marmoricola sp.]
MSSIIDSAAEVATANSTAPIAATGNSTGRLALLVSIVVSFLAASAAPTPLYEHYDVAWGGTALTTTIAFGIYAGAVLVGLLTLGEVSNHLGRRTVILAALSGQAIAMVLFAAADSYTPLMIGRVVQGLAAGAALGALGAGMIDAHRESGTLASATAPGIGTGTGALAAALVVNYLPWPTHLIYLILIAVFVAQAAAITRLPFDAGHHRPGLLKDLRPQIAVPRAARAAFLSVAPVLFSAWALAGFYGSLGPVLMRQLADSTSVTLGGFGLFLLAGVASLATLALRHVGTARTMQVGITALVIGVLGTIVAVEAGSIDLFLVATAVAGIGFGSGLQGGIRTVVPLATEAQRTGLLAAVYLVSYLGLGAPAVVAGYLVSRGLDLEHVAVGYAIVLVVLALAAGASLRLRRARA